MDDQSHDALWVVSRRKGVFIMEVIAVLLLLALGFLLAQGIGRWGNFFNREAFGAATDSFFRMGLFNDRTQAWEMRSDGTYARFVAGRQNPTG